MEGIVWWLVHGVQIGVLVTVLVLALAPARRLGGHTLYGNLLFLMALGFWSLLIGEVIYLAHKALGAWHGPGSFNDVPNLVGWVLLWLSILLFVERFSPVGTSRRATWAYLAACMLAPTAAILLLFRLWLSPPGADPDASIRVAYLAVDGLTIGAILGGIDRFRRLGKGALGRLYIVLGVAIVVKTASDTSWAYLAARDATSLVPTMLGPLAGLIAVVGLVGHYRAMRVESLDDARVPWRHWGQQRLAVLARRIHEVAGGYAARTALLAAASAMEARGLSVRLESTTLVVQASAEAWTEAIAVADDVAVRLLGQAGQEIVGQAVATQGVRR